MGCDVVSLMVDVVVIWLANDTFTGVLFLMNSSCECE
jgi:hypothetical protein